MKEKYIEIEIELDQIMLELGMNLLDKRRSFKWLKELIMIAVYSPDGWQNDYLQNIGKRERLTRERVRQMLYKVVWDNWSDNSKKVLDAHFGYPIQTQFEYVKPNHIEFIALISGEICKKYKIQKK